MLLDIPLIILTSIVKVTNLEDMFPISIAHYTTPTPGVT